MYTRVSASQTARQTKIRSTFKKVTSPELQTY